MRNRDFALSIGLSEAQVIALYCAIRKAKRLRIDAVALLKNAPKLGTVLVLTHNDHAVHEITGCFEKIIYNNHVLITIDKVNLRIFSKQWEFGFKYDVVILRKPRKSLQFFDKCGVAILKIYSKETTNMEKWNRLVKKLLHEDQLPVLDVLPTSPLTQCNTENLGAEKFRDRWRQMTSAYQLHGIISELKINQRDVVKYAESKFADELAIESIEAMFNQAAQQEIPIMCFVGNKGCVQIFSGAVKNIKQVGSWLNVLDQKFHLHLLISEIDSVWRVCKPTKNSHVHSLEVFNKNGEMIIQFFDLRKEGQKEQENWRSLLNNLPKIKKQK